MWRPLLCSVAAPEGAGFPDSAERLENLHCNKPHFAAHKSHPGFLHWQTSTHTLCFSGSQGDMGSSSSDRDEVLEPSCSLESDVLSPVFGALGVFRGVGSAVQTGLRFMPNASWHLPVSAFCHLPWLGCHLCGSECDDRHTGPLFC